MRPNLVLVLRVRDKQVIEFVGKPLRLEGCFGVINIFFNHICVCIRGRRHNMFFKARVAVQL